MKIKSVIFKENKMFKDLKILFNDNKKMDFTIIVGEDGVGKSTLLKQIHSHDTKKEFVEIDFSNEKLGNVILIDNLNIESDAKYCIESSILFFARENYFKKDYIYIKHELINKINNSLENIKTKVKLQDIIMNEEKNIVFTTFKNGFVENMALQELSLSEQKILSLVIPYEVFEIKDSIILLDDFEMILHPKTQQSIIKLYEEISKNNQLIITTNSPYLLSSIKKENIIRLNKDELGFTIINNDFNETYGHKQNDISLDILGVKTERNEFIDGEIEHLRELLRNKKHNSYYFKTKLKALKNYLGNYDIDLHLIELEVARLNIKRKPKKYILRWQKGVTTDTTKICYTHGGLETLREKAKALKGDDKLCYITIDEIKEVIKDTRQDEVERILKDE